MCLVPSSLLKRLDAIGAGFPHRERSFAEASGVDCKVGVMVIRPIDPQDRIRELCARAAATDDPDELKEIAAQLRAELQDDSARRRGAVDENRSRAG